MKSICIKTNNPESINYLLNQLKNSKIENIYFSCKKFKIYKNIIIHFKGIDEQKFLKDLSRLLSSLVINVFEKKIINKIISNEYFYFDKLEQRKIFQTTIKDLYDDKESVYPNEKCFSLLCNNFYDYLETNKSIVLNGFITFRIKNYIEIIFEQIDKSVTKFLIDKEYNEFITLLKIYINTEKCNCDVVHLIYSNSKSILLDKNKNVIKSNENMFNAKYLSDISFSSSDYALNTLLTLLPKKLYLHVINNKEDEFLKTLKLIFENRIVFCTDCEICNLYKKIEQKY